MKNKKISTHAKMPQLRDITQSISKTTSNIASIYELMATLERQSKPKTTVVKRIFKLRNNEL